MKILRPKEIKEELNDCNFIIQFVKSCPNKEAFISSCIKKLEDQKIEFYNQIGICLSLIGFAKPHVTREGDVNIRFDATIIDETQSIPIEIKSPREVREINIKSIRQAFENKIILLSRKFYDTTNETTSLAIAFDYPANRSDVIELIHDIKEAFGFNIGIINICDLLSLVYDVQRNHLVLDFNYFRTFNGRFNYEKAFC